MLLAKLVFNLCGLVWTISKRIVACGPFYQRQDGSAGKEVMHSTLLDNASSCFYENRYSKSVMVQSASLYVGNGSE